MQDRNCDASATGPSLAEYPHTRDVGRPVDVTRTSTGDRLAVQTAQRFDARARASRWVRPIRAGLPSPITPRHRRQLTRISPPFPRMSGGLPSREAAAPRRETGAASGLLDASGGAAQRQCVGLRRAEPGAPARTQPGERSRDLAHHLHARVCLCDSYSGPYPGPSWPAEPACRWQPPHPPRIAVRSI